MSNNNDNKPNWGSPFYHLLSAIMAVLSTLLIGCALALVIAVLAFIVTLFIDVEKALACLQVIHSVLFGTLLQ